MNEVKNAALPLLLEPRNAGENNREYAYRVIRRNIMTAQLQPGCVLNEAELCEQLGMSRTPVHEALSMLRTEWLAEILPQRGSRVSLIRVDYVKEGYAMRSMLEPSIIRRLAGSVSAERLSELRANLEEQASAAREDTVAPGSRFVELDNEFHRAIYHLAENDRIWQSVHAVTSHYDRVRYLDTALYQENITDILSEHWQIYNCLLIGIPSDSDVDLLMEKHLGRFRTRFLDLINRFPDYFG